jgi:hypothetical protein
MSTRYFSRWFWLALAAVCLTVLFSPRDAATQSKRSPNVKTGDGLSVVTFTVPAGTLTVNLPDDIRAGDTISGTVIAEPKGQTIEERARNLGVLNGLVLEIDGKRVSPFSRNPEKERESVIQQTIWIYTANQPKPVDMYKPGDSPTRPVPIAVSDSHGNDAQASILFWKVLEGFQKAAQAMEGMTPSGAVITPDPKITPPGMTPKGAVITPDPKITPPGMTPKGAVITPDPKITPPTHPSGAIITPDPKITPSFIIPPLGQTGRPIVITGPFDGNASNTTLNGAALRTSVQDFEKNTENVSGGFGLLAESPRKAVFRSPENVVGPIKITLKEGITQTTGTYRNIGVDLTAPKTSLLKGESTELRVQVNGLEGIKTPIPLTLECKGVITMTGGNYQALTIQPSQVGADGSYSTTRGITGVQAGGWGATATVVTGPFNVCFQDDSRAATVILWNTVSGDYSFRPPGGSSAPPTGGAPLTGKGTMVMKGCVLTLQHNAPDRRIFATLDTCKSAGSAAVEIPANKEKFTITDRNTTDNTCAVQ